MLKTAVQLITARMVEVNCVDILPCEVPASDASGIRLELMLQMLLFDDDRLVSVSGPFNARWVLPDDGSSANISSWANSTAAEMISEYSWSTENAPEPKKAARTPDEDRSVVKPPLNASQI